MTPRPPDFFVQELALIDPLLTLQWDHGRHAFWLQSVRGTDPKRMEVVPYGLFAPSELDRVLLTSIRQAIHRRNAGVTIREIMQERRAKADAEEEAKWKSVGDAAHDLAMREVEAANPSSKIFSQGDAGYRHGNRIAGMIPKEYRG